MADGAGKPKPAFFIAVLAVVAGLVGLAFYRCNAKKSGGDAGSGSGSEGYIDPNIVKKNGSGSAVTAENNDPNAPPTTVSEYSWDSASKLPEVPGTAAYESLGKPRVVKFAVNVWAGWAPILWANQGAAAKKVWKDAKGGEFQVQLKLIDDPVGMGNSVANGTVQIGWATVDMLPLIVERLKRDPRTMPRVYQQIDWSNGGDGIVVRDTIKDVSDLRGKTVVLAQNSPSHFFLLNVLLQGGVQPTEVKMKFTKDAFQAAAAFNQNKDIAGVVTWAPDIYNLTKTGMGNKMLVSTLTANKLIADVWFARADFARDNPEIIEGLVRGILDATDELSKNDASKQSVGKMMDEFYSLPPGTGGGMLADAHWTNYAENRDFFLVASNPTNFERTYDTAHRLYKAIRVLEGEKIPFDKIMDFSVIKKLGAEPKYAESKNEYEFKFTPATGSEVNVESSVLTKTVTINFFPNSFDLYKKVPAKGGAGEMYYDGNVEYTIEEIAKLAGQFGAARIVIEGHTDGSMKGSADESLVKELSTRRANAVKEGLVNKFKMQPNQFSVNGLGWGRPADPKDPDNHAKNRRVEIKVVPAEAQ
ncbi:MAG: OmpA family protein [Deltaproteobacteria bacterium]|nr:OmpA family protein [Deltaproteobacteria bacterium]